VRILRVARFAARFARFGFRVAHGTHALMKKMVTNGEVDALVPERVWKELSRALGEANPEKFFTVLNACGALTRILPPLAPLFPANESRHRAPPPPALQAFIEASQRSDDSRIRLAALLRYLPINNLKNLCQHLRIPNDYAELAQLLVEHFDTLCQADTLDAVALLEVLEKTDAFRRDARFELLLQACQVLAPDAQAALQRLQQARQIAAQVEARQFVEQGLQGLAIKQALQAERVRVLASF
jgi:tRNA nucleotidyltransferase (CCA-adding enzyme)